MLGAMSPIWPKAAQVFHNQAEEYDGWFDHSLLFDIELGALKQLTTVLGEPRLEVGVGPGRFAQELGVCLGIDPAHGALVLAQKRIKNVCQGVGEHLPVQTGATATVFLLFTLCFAEQPNLLIRELGRILRAGGHVVIGFIPQLGPWGQALMAKRDEGHPFYQHSHFYTAGQVRAWLDEAGLKVVEERCSLFQKPGEVNIMESSQPGGSEKAGFMIVVAQK